MKQHIARKRFGQNFLVDQQVIGNIIASLSLRATDQVVEIGPGLGALTLPLINALPHLTVIEIDRDIVTRLSRQISPARLTIHQADALAFDFASLKPNENSKIRLIGNLPYNISTPLLFHLATFADAVYDMHFMLQKEVVDRMVAAPCSSDYGRLSVMLQYLFVIDWLFDVPPEAFDPAPKVNSSVVRLIPKPPELLTAANPAQFSTLVAAAFSQRRKMLRNTLKDFADEAMLRAQGISPTSRAEELSVDDYIGLSNALSSCDAQ